MRGLGVAKLGLSGVGVGGVRGRKTRASFLPKASLTTRNSQFYLKKYFLGCGGVGGGGVGGCGARAQWGGGCWG